MSTIQHDLQHALRVFKASPLSAAAAIGALALGIGANTLVFSFADALLTRPLPVHEPNRVVALFHMSVDAGSYSSFSYPDYVELRDRNDTLSGLVAWSPIDVRLGADGAERAPAQIVSGDYFDVLGVRAALGRTFHPEEDRTRGTHAVVVIGDGLWRRQFGADPAVAGRRLVVNGVPFEIVGVAPRGFRGLEVTSAPDLWVPLMMHDVAMPSFKVFDTVLFFNRGTHWLNLAGRLRPGLTARQAEAALRIIANRQAESNPDTNRGWTISVVPVNDARLGAPSEREVVSVAKLLVAVVGVVLLIACANVANLLLARGVARRREIAIRLAVGADRRRLVRQFMTESFALAAAGGLAGLLLALAGMRWLTFDGLTATLPGIEVALDGRVLAFTLLVGIATGLIFGIVPAWQASAAVSPSGLRTQRSDVGIASRRSPLGQALVAVQVGLCLVLLIGAGLTLRTVWNLQRVPLGFEPEDVWLAPVDMGDLGYTDTRGREILQQSVERMRALPGVEAAAVGLVTPFSPLRMANDIFWERDDDRGERRRTNVDMNVVGAGYFEAMRIPIVRGRAFEDTDPGAAIVNQSLADRLWPSRDPIGRRLWSWNPNGPDRPLEVVGVAQDGGYHRGWRTGAQPFLFVPFPDWYFSSMSIHARMRPGAALARADVARELRGVEAALPPADVRSVTAAMAGAISVERSSAALLALFGLLALAIAGIGIYGVVSFVASQRTYEMAVRMALGASRSAIAGLVIGQGTKPVVIGVALGWCAALLLSRFVEAQLYGVRPTDPVTFVTVAVTLVAIGIAASSLPAWRATRVDPLKALRTE